MLFCVIFYSAFKQTSWAVKNKNTNISVFFVCCDFHIHPCCHQMITLAIIIIAFSNFLTFLDYYHLICEFIRPPAWHPTPIDNVDSYLVLFKEDDYQGRIDRINSWNYFYLMYFCILPVDWNDTVLIITLKTL